LRTGSNGPTLATPLKTAAGQDAFSASCVPPN
jgi:hypothetical protein